jgi:ribosomal-protein-serine acetyltransferase
MFQMDLGEGAALRLMQERDAEDIYNLTQQYREELREWLPWVDRTRSVEEPRQFILKSIEEYGKREALAACICVDGRVAGAISLHKIDALNFQTSIGYWLAGEYQGRGVMTRACRALVSHAFTEYGLHRVEIRCATGNTKSCAIPRRLGFQREGVLREAEWVSGRFLDLVVWGMLVQDWKP